MVYLQICLPNTKIRNINNITSVSNIFSKQVCQDFINARKQSDSGANKLNEEDKQHFKYMDLKYLNPKIIEVLKTLIIRVNLSAYNFDITDIDAGYIFKNESGNYSDWYFDLGYDEYTTTRKLTALVFLTSLKDYQGGELSYLLGNSNEKFEQGTVIIFPSYQLYRFEPILKGSQQIFVCWALGPAYH